MRSREASTEPPKRRKNLDFLGLKLRFDFAGKALFPKKADLQPHPNGLVGSRISVSRPSEINANLHYFSCARGSHGRQLLDKNVEKSHGEAALKPSVHRLPLALLVHVDSAAG